MDPNKNFDKKRKYNILVEVYHCDGAKYIKIF